MAAAGSWQAQAGYVRSQASQGLHGKLERYEKGKEREPKKNNHTQEFEPGSCSHSQPLPGVFPVAKVVCVLA